MSVTLQMPRKDWDFAHEPTDYATHSLHPYPARMPPPLARSLISEYSAVGEVVLDPFCGSGTVLVEASLSGRSSIGVDINPLAVLVARAKTTPIDHDRLCSAIDNILSSLKARRNLHASRVDFENVNHWFKRCIQERLARLRYLIDSVYDPDLRRFFQICFSVTVRQVANTRKGEFKPWRLPSKDLRVHRPDVYEVFSRTALDRARMIQEYKRMLSQAGFSRSSDVVLGDARSLSLRKGFADLVVTSPPYGDSMTTVAYGQFCKFSSLWVGLPRHLATRLDRICLGGQVSAASIQSVSSPTLSRTLKVLEDLGSTRMPRVSQFFADLVASLTSIERCLKRGGMMCLVVGNRTVSRIQLPTDEILEELILGVGKFDHEGTLERHIPMKTLPWMNAPENIAGRNGKTISTESILIFSKQT